MPQLEGRTDNQIMGVKGLTVRLFIVFIINCPWSCQFSIRDNHLAAPSIFYLNGLNPGVDHIFWSSLWKSRYQKELFAVEVTSASTAWAEILIRVETTWSQHLTLLLTFAQVVRILFYHWQHSFGECSQLTDQGLLDQSFSYLSQTFPKYSLI